MDNNTVMYEGELYRVREIGGTWAVPVGKEEALAETARELRAMSALDQMCAIGAVEEIAVPVKPSDICVKRIDRILVLVKAGAEDREG